MSEGRIIWISGFDYSEGVHILMYKIPAAVDGTTKFLNQAYISVGSLTKLLVGYPEKEAKIWRKNECRSVEDEKMTNQTLRIRFGIDPKNYSMASRLIKEATLSYVPFWA